MLYGKIDMNCWYGLELYLLKVYISTLILNVTGQDRRQDFSGGKQRQMSS